MPTCYTCWFPYGQRGGVCLKTTRHRRTPQDVTDRRKTPILTKRLCVIACFIHHVHELKPMNERKIQQKYKIQTAKMRRDATGRHIAPQDRDVAKRLAAVLSTDRVGFSNEQSTPSVDNKATIVIPGHCSVAVST